MNNTTSYFVGGFDLLLNQQQFTTDVALLIQKASILGVKLTFGEAYRSVDQQLLCFYGMTVRSKDKGLFLRYTKSRCKNLVSNHMRRLAVDFHFFVSDILTYTDPKIEELGMYWESLNKKNRWGGNFDGGYDAQHFERKIY